MKDRKDITVPIPGELNDQIESELEYGDHKSEWVREAIRQRLDAEAADADGKEIDDIMDAVKDHNIDADSDDAEDTPDDINELPNDDVLEAGDH
jgi:Arc/MetJ-type ribon-helix-helix transcriptional regulator